MRSQELYNSIAVIIIRVFSKIARAKRGVLKNAKCTWSSRDCICSNFYLTNHLLDVSLKRKTENISIIILRMFTEERAKAVFMLQQGNGVCIQIPVSC